MKNLKYVLVFAVLIANGNLFAQQDPSYTLYKYNMNLINPAYVGTSDNTELNLNIRNQWAGMNDAPETKSISFLKPIGERIGIGFSIVNDKIHIQKQTDFSVDFSYKVPISETADIYFGVKAGAYALDVDFLSLAVQGDPLFAENVDRVNGIFGAGAYLKVNKLYVSLSIPNFLNGHRAERTGVDSYTDATDKLHIFAGAGYEFDLTGSFSLEPSVMARFVEGAPSSIDLTAMANFYKKFEIGGSYRIDESFSAIVMLKIADWLEFGYAYEVATSEVKYYSDGTHEIMLRFNLNSF